MDTSALKFSPHIMKTDLAEEYLKSNEIKEILSEDPLKVPTSVLHKKLAQKVVEHTELFCQLEYLSRGASAEDVRNNVKLIAQNLNLHNQNYKFTSTLSRVHLNDDVPLAVLGYVLLSRYEACKIVSRKQRAAAYLFTKLCHEVGLKNVGYEPVVTAVTLNNWAPPSGCTGVIAERSDLDSAVDAFLSSSIKSFWRLNRIFVQENIYESLKKAVEWKCGLKEQSSTEVRDDLKTLCTEVYAYSDKCLLVDYAGDETADRFSLPHLIYVEAYRTTNELLSLIAKYDDTCLSLWSSDAAEANEIAYTVASRLVWVNDFANFDGPPAASQWFYSNCLISYIDNKFIIFPDIKMEEVVTWRKYDRKRRFNIIYKALETYEADVELATKLQDRILKLNNNTTIDIGKTMVCVTINLPAGVIQFPQTCSDIDCLNDIIELLINGNAVALTHVIEDFKPVLQALKKAGAPAIFSSPNEPVQEIKSSFYAYRTRVILSNFGTIFAN